MFQAPATPPKKLSISLDFRIISLVLLLIIVAMLAVWKPWQKTTVGSRKITVSGSSTVKAVPDEYQLSPYFEFTGDHAKATSDASAMATEVTAKLKELGVKDSEVSSNTSAYNQYVYAAGTDAAQPNLQLSYTISLVSKDLAQKVQDYFLSTTAKGQLSPQATFSEAKQKQLTAQARQNAIDDAKTNAQKSAEQVGAKLGKVVTITDDGTSGGLCGPSGLCSAGTMSMSSAAIAPAADAKASIAVQPGQNDFSASVQVEYELR